jgi:hypothetical protein
MAPLCAESLNGRKFSDTDVNPKGRNSSLGTRHSL